MRLFEMRNIVFALIGVLLIACTKEVTNNVLPSKSSTSTRQGAPQTSATESGGVINGGGGKGVLCKKNGSQTLEVLDLYEARNLFKLKMKNFGSTENEAIQNLGTVLGKHFYSPDSGNPEESIKVMRESIETTFQMLSFVEKETTLKDTKDSFEPSVEQGCEIVQIAVFYNEGSLLVNRSLWEQLDWTNKMALYAHEWMYYRARRNGETNSMNTRKLVGFLFSESSLRSVYDGVPQDRNQYLFCRISMNRVYRGSFFMYNKQNEYKTNGIEIVFKDMSDLNPLFKTWVYLDGITIYQLLTNPNYNGSSDQMIVQDMLPSENRLGMEFLGLRDNQLKAKMTIFKKTKMFANDSTGYDVTCDRVFDFSGFLTPPAQEIHLEKSNTSYETVDTANVDKDGQVSKIQTSRVDSGGWLPENIKLETPTICSYKEKGYVISQSEDRTYFAVSGFELIENAKNSTDCSKFIEAVNKRASLGEIKDYLTYSEFRK